MSIKTKKARAVDTSTPLALGVGLFTGWIVTILLAIIIAVLVAGEQIRAKMLAPAAVITLIIAAFAAAYIAAKKSGQNRLLVCLISGGIYFVSLVCCTALFFDGAYQGLGGALLTIMGSSLVVGMMGMKQKTQKNRYFKRRYRG